MYQIESHSDIFLHVSLYIPSDTNVSFLTHAFDAQSTHTVADTHSSNKVKGGKGNDDSGGGDNSSRYDRMSDDTYKKQCSLSFFRSVIGSGLHYIMLDSLRKDNNFAIHLLRYLMVDKSMFNDVENMPLDMEALRENRELEDMSSENIIRIIKCSLLLIEMIPTTVCLYMYIYGA